MKKSSAAAGLCAWVLGIYQYHKLTKSGATQSPQKPQLSSPVKTQNAQKADALAEKQKELEKAKLELDQLHKKKTQILS